MNKEVHLALRKSSNPEKSSELERIEAFLEVKRNGEVIKSETGYLPSAESLFPLLKNWKETYHNLYQNRSRSTWRRLIARIKANKGQTKNFSISQLKDECEKNAHQLKANFNDWLDESPEFRNIAKKVRTHLNPEDQGRILIRSNLQDVLSLPWNQWKLLEDYSNFEIAISTIDAESIMPTQQNNCSSKVKILAILGNSKGINVNRDRRLLEQIERAEITFLDKPKKRDINDELWEKGYDLMFFAGHSRTEENQGCIEINDTDSLNIQELKDGLKTAINNGLQLAIFNSCDGLGLVWQLRELHIPHLIVMCAPIPDLVAQEFLKYFLDDYSKDDSFYGAVRKARTRLNYLEKDYPCPNWLPIIYSNPLEKSPTLFPPLSDVSSPPDTIIPPVIIGEDPTSPGKSGGKKKRTSEKKHSINKYIILPIIGVAIIGIGFISIRGFIRGAIAEAEQLIKKGRYGTACQKLELIKYIPKAKELCNEPEEVIVGLIQAEQFMKDKMYPQALTELENLSGTYPNKSKVMRLLAEVQLKNKLPLSAIETFKQYLEKEPHDIDAQILLGKAYIAVYKTEDAKNIGYKLLKYQENPKVYSLYADAQSDLGNKRIALENYEKAEELYKKAGVELSSSKDYIEVLINKGNVLYQLSSYEKTIEDRDKMREEALKIFEQVLKSASDNEQKMQGLYRVIQLEKSLGNSVKAEGIYKQYCEQEQLCDPNDPDRFYTIAMIQEQLGNKDEEKEFWDQAYIHLNDKTKNEPENVKALVDLAFVESKLRGFKVEALKKDSMNRELDSYNKALDIAPDSAIILQKKANVLAQLGRHDEALNIIQQVLNEQPENYEAWYLKGNILVFKAYSPTRPIDKTSAKDALYASQKAVNLRPTSYEGWYLKATALSYLQENKEALESVEKSINLNPNFDLAKQLKEYLED